MTQAFGHWQPKRQRDLSHHPARIARGLGVLALLALFVLSSGASAQAWDDALSQVPVQGSPDAPITIVEYGDFQCPFCSVFSREVKPLIHQNYIETGQVRFEFRHFPAIGATSLHMAHAALCAHTQGAFWEYHDYLYDEGRNARTQQAFIDVAESMDLDIEAFAECLEDERVAQVVGDDFRAARRLGVVNTPTFIVNNEYLVVGARPYEYWDQLINVLLQAANE